MVRCQKSSFPQRFPRFSGNRRENLTMRIWKRLFPLGFSRFFRPGSMENHPRWPPASFCTHPELGKPTFVKFRSIFVFFDFFDPGCMEIQLFPFHFQRKKIFQILNLMKINYVSRFKVWVQLLLN